MNLGQHIEDVRDGIRAGRHGNEAAVSQGIVLRLLQALDWPTYNTQIVCPEYSLAEKRVDFALCHPANKDGRTRRYLARSPDDLYPGRPDLARELVAKLKSGWFVGTKVGHAGVRQIVEMACEVAALRYGEDVIVRIGE